ncbi:MAG: DUF4846 domain-containing protein [Bacteroidota bacterium]
MDALPASLWSGSGAPAPRWLTWCWSSAAVVVLLACQPAPPTYVDPTGTTIQTRFPTPEGFTRASYPTRSFAAYLRDRPLEPHGSKVYLYDGREKNTQRVHAAVLDVDVGRRDLQQCADAVMRLRAEYLWSEERYNDISFNFVSGFPAEYRRWRGGERIRVRGNTVNWVPGGGPDASYAAFRKYLTMVFAYAGTASLVHELKPRPLEDITVGDVFIRGGSPGHAVIVVDKVVDSAGEAMVLLAQSFMPAQDIHVLLNPLATDGNPWHRVADMEEEVRTAEHLFAPDELRHFPE